MSLRPPFVFAGGFIRHPGYLAMALIFGFGALAVGSWWALLPAAGYDLLILNRAAREDRPNSAPLSRGRIPKSSRKVPAIHARPCEIPRVSAKPCKWWLCRYISAESLVFARKSQGNHSGLP
jgi:hypothetical protein